MPSIPPAASDASPNRSRPRLELKFMDGLRALAALYVVMHHCYSKLIADSALWPGGVIAMPMWSGWLRFGNFAVDVFIVLSGFLLMLPVGLSPTRSLDGGIKPFIQRRARRIVPTYYAALVYSCILLIAGMVLGGRTGSTRNVSADLNAGTLISHVLLIHNLVPAWFKQINAPMWSVATEWQIYFLLPLFLLPVFRRAGIAATLIGGVLLGLVPHWIGWTWAETAQSWQFSLFTMGATGALIAGRSVQALSEGDTEAGDLHPARWTALSAVVAMGIVVFLAVRGDLYDRFWVPLDLLTGVATIGLILSSFPTAVGQRTGKSPILRLMEARWTTGIGKFSYSLYLTHSPLLAIIYLAIRRAHCGPGLSLLLLIGVGLPISLAFAYVFYTAFERPLLRSRRPRLDLEAPDTAATKAILSRTGTT